MHNGLIAASLLTLGGCVSFGPPSTAEAFAGRRAPNRATYALPDGRRLATAETGNPAGPLVLFVHGSPGSWRDFAHVMADTTLAERARLVSVDRLGWGGSATGGLETSLEAQARGLRAVLEAYSANLPAIVVGHSLGGPVAARLAMDASEQVGGLVLVAGSIDPALEKTTWYQAIGRRRLVRWAVPEVLVRADEEIKPLKAELEAISERWGELRMPVTVIHGERDRLVPRANADFALRVLSHAPVTLESIPRQGHLIPWQRPELITTAILRQVDAISDGAGSG